MGVKYPLMGVWFATIWILEYSTPFYAQFQQGLRDKIRHDAKNLGLAAINAGLTAVFLGAALPAIETGVSGHATGLLGMVAWPSWIEVTLAFVLLDFWMYVWHRANHRVPLLWRLHRTHHSDPQMDASTGARFHPGEIILGGFARLVVILVLGTVLWQLVIYEAVLFGVVLLHHSNVRLPTWLDHGLLVLVVTPAMHRVHHSRLHAEHDSNYGSVFPYWDQALGSFRLRTDARTIEIGLDGFDDPRWQGFTSLLRTPFRNQ